MKKLQPILQFIDENGGWADEETGNFLGIDNLTKALDNGTLSKDVMEALDTLGVFMGEYLIDHTSTDKLYTSLHQEDTEQ